MRPGPASAPPAPAPAGGVSLPLANETQTEALGRWFAPRLRPGDVLLLEGPIGAGKTQFARALIQARLAAEGRREDVPSPTFTLVQVYEAEGVEIWHADLYRLTAPEEAAELGLEEAFETAICLVEWPDRLGPFTPAGALTLRFTLTEGGASRRVEAVAADPRWTTLLAALAGWSADA